MADKIRFIMHNHADLATLSASPTPLTTLPVENIQKVPRSKIMRSSSAATTTINGDFASTKTVSAMVLGRHNLTKNCTVTFNIYSGASQTSLLATSGPVTVTEIMAYEAASVLEYQDIKSIAWFSKDGNGDKLAYTNVLSFSIVINPGTGSNSYFDVGRIMVGDYIQPTYNLSNGYTLSYEEETKQFRTASGTLRSDMSLPYKTFTFNLDTVSETDRGILLEAFADVGLRKDFFLSIFPECINEQKQLDYSGIMKLSKTPTFTGIQSSWYKTKYTMDEV
jgi:hypothetical protein